MSKQSRLGVRPGNAVKSAEWLFLVAAVLHLLAVPEHAAIWVGYEVFFIVTAVVQGAYSLLLPRLFQQRWFLAVGVALTVGLLGLWVQSRLWHAPVGPHRLHAEPFGLLDVTVAVVELLTVLCLAALIARQSTRRRYVSPPAHREPLWI